MSTQFHARTTSPVATQGPTVQASKFTTTTSANTALAGKEGTPSEAVEELNIESAINDADHKMAKRSKAPLVATPNTRSYTVAGGRGSALNPRPVNHTDCSSPNSAQQTLRQEAHGKSTSQEAAIADGRAKRARFEVSNDGVKIEFDETTQRQLMTAVNAKDLDFLAGLLREVGSTGVQGGRPDEGQINFVLSAVRGSEPVDQMDAMLSMQMTAVHRAAMKLAGSLANPEEMRLFAKLVQTYAAQMDTRKRYRSDDRAISVQQNVVPVSMLRKLQSEKK